MTSLFNKPQTPSYWIDTHCHIDANYRQKGQSIEVALQKSQSLGVQKWIAIGLNQSSYQEVTTLAEQYPERIYTALGIHPLSVRSLCQALEKEGLNKNSFEERFKQETQKLKKQLEDKIKHKSVVAVGEGGFEFYDHRKQSDSTEECLRYEDEQKSLFSFQIELAKKHNLPFILHSRYAEQETYEALKAWDFHNFVAHCFSGSEHFLKQMLDLGGMISVTGLISFKNAQSLRDIIAKVPLNRLMIETDSPYMAPEPVRGRPCQPAYVAYVGEALAQVLGKSVQEVQHLTTENAHQFFSKLV